MNARKHWDVELVEAVGRLIIPRYRSVGYLSDHQRERIYAVIAVVEDGLNPNWESMAKLTRMQNDSLARYQNRHRRVRERAELRFGIPAVHGTYQVGYAAAMYDILRVLDGSDDE